MLQQIANLRLIVKAIALILGGFSLAAAQTVDPLFAPVLQSNGASSSTNFSQVFASALQPDGKIVVGGRFRIAGNALRGAPQSGVARFNSDGTPDAAFDAGDITTVESGSNASNGGDVYAVKLQPDGKILIGGRFRRGVEFRALERLNADGSSDAAFAPLAAGAVKDIELQPDGKIIVGGSFAYTATNPATGQTATFTNLARLNQDGSFDFGFTGSGLPESNEIAVLPDGKFVVGNAAASSRLVRYNANGTVDAVLADYNNWIEAVETQPDNKILVAGSLTVNNQVRLLNRFNADGTLDASFAANVGTPYDISIAANGKITVGGNLFINTFRDLARLNSDGSLDASFDVAAADLPGAVVRTVLVLPDDKVFAGGAFSLYGFYNNVARVNADGTRDTSFNGAFAAYGGRSYAILQQPDGKILVGGDFAASSSNEGDGYARYNADGTPDANFVRYTQDGSFIVYDFALQSNGKILYVRGGSPATNLFRLNADGANDETFPRPFRPSSGTSLNTDVKAIAVRADDKIWVGGFLISGTATAPDFSVLVRLNADGTFDAAFPKVFAAGGGRKVYDFAVQPDGKIVIGGDFSQINNQPAANLARINPDGTIDASFNQPPISGIVKEIELQPNGKIVYGTNGTIRRVNADGSPDASFAAATLAADGSPISLLEALRVQPNGKILVGGNFIAVNNAPRIRIARLNADGSLDASFNLPGGANDVVHHFAIQNDNKILVAGAFTRIGNAPRIGAARLLAPTVARRVSFDFDGDARADIAVFRPSEGNWYKLLSGSSNAFGGAAQWGVATDKLAPADYDGDGKTDFAVWRDDADNPGQAVFYILNSRDNTVRVEQFGSRGDVPVSADFDNDGKADLAVYRAGTATETQSRFYYRPSSQPGAGFAAIDWGVRGDVAAVGDYDGDGATDAAVFRPSNGTWYIRQSSGATRFVNWGVANDHLIQADYDGDNKTDIAVWRSGTWYILQSSLQDQPRYERFGLSGDIPVAADYDGDARADIAVWRPSTGVWWMQQSQAGFLGVTFGVGSDRAIPAAYSFSTAQIGVFTEKPSVGKTAKITIWR